MAAPSVTNIYPALGHTGGEAMVRFLGLNFREPPDPGTLTRDDPTPGPSVRVTFGGVAADYVGVVNSSLMMVRTPASPLLEGREGNAAGPVDVVVTNLDSAGAPIPGESVTVVGGFTYAYTKLSNNSGTLQRVVRAMLRVMRQQIYPNVVYMGHSDYDDDTGDGLNIVEVATLPSVAMVGPQIAESRFHTTNEMEYVDAHGHNLRRREPFLGDLTFTVIGTADHTGIALNLQAETIAFFHRFARIRIQRDPNDVSVGYNEYDVVVPQDGPASIGSPSDDSNLRTFTHRFMIRGFPVQGLAGFAESSIGADSLTDEVGGQADDIILDIEAI